MNNLPEWYKEGIERVSKVVEFVYPFTWNSKERYLKWLADNDIWENDYLTEAQDVGTFIHLQMEKFIKWEELDTDDILYDLHKEEIDYWLNFIKWIRAPSIKTEVVVRDKYNRFQWTIDLVLIDEDSKQVYLFDWKTWWIAKKKYWLPNVYRKPYSKLKKLALQLSLYAETFKQKGYTIGAIVWVWLHETWVYDYVLDSLATEEIDKILNDFVTKDVKLPPDTTLLINYKTMKIEIQTVIPDNAYSKASVILEEWDFKTPTQWIEECIRLQKELLAKYK